MTSPTDDRLRRSFDYAADVDAVAMARRDVSAFVSRHITSGNMGSAEEVSRLIERLRLVVSELCSNAIEAAPEQWFRVAITIGRSDDGGSEGRWRAGVICSVTNPRVIDQAAVVLPVGDVPDPFADRGRGLVIVQGLADRVWVDQTPETTAVNAELTLGAAA